MHNLVLVCLETQPAPDWSPCQHESCVTWPGEMSTLESRSGTKWRQTATKLSWQRPEPRARLLGKLRRMILSSNYPSHDPDTGVAPAVTSLATRSHQAHGDNAMLGSRNGFSLTLSGLSFSDRIVIDVRLNGSDDPDDSIELRNQIVVEAKIDDIVFVCISLVHLFEIHHA